MQSVLCQTHINHDILEGSLRRDCSSMFSVGVYNSVLFAPATQEMLHQGVTALGSLVNMKHVPLFPLPILIESSI